MPADDVLRSVEIPRRFRGPTHSANGGYACGLIASVLGPVATVTLRAPPPLDRPLALARKDGRAALLDGERLLGEGVPEAPEIEGPPPVTVEAAHEALTRTPWTPQSHPLPECFVCGPARAPDDGLRLSTGPVEGICAAPWMPDPGLGDENGLIRAEYLWSALDCPSGQASSLHSPGRPEEVSILLGRLSARIEARPPISQPLVVTARHVAREGRKLIAEAAVHDAEGRRGAVGRATSILSQ